MKVIVFSTKSYDKQFLEQANVEHAHELSYFDVRLTRDTASLADGFPVVCAFVHDLLDGDVLRILHEQGTRFIVLRSAGFNHVDLHAADKLGMTVARVPAYSPHAVAEHALALILSLNRRTHKAYNRVRDGNFSLEGLLGFDLHGKTVGVIGTGKIGVIFMRIMHSLGCRVLAFDPVRNPEAEAVGEYVSLTELFQASDILSLHCPLTRETHHLIDDHALGQMREGAMLINTSRGEIVDTRAVINGLKSGKLGYLGLDVYEEEESLFFADFSDRVIQDDVFMRLLTFPNVLITGHQGFFTREALTNIAETTIANLTAFETGKGTLHRVTGERMP